MSNDRPKRLAPENLASMTPVQAWNAALDALDEMIGWEAFWNDGRDVDTGEYKLNDDGTWTNPVESYK